MPFSVMAQGNPLDQCFDGITNFTDITLDDLLACVDVMKAFGQTILDWFLALLSDFLDYFFGSDPITT
ncbi:MAG: hypothetical protein H6908_03070 [Hyphomicrobiales bacterium]|nr:hypothetical protein [Hyphomicrobiales bacterium]